MPKKRGSGWLWGLLRCKAIRAEKTETQRLLGVPITTKQEAYAVACHVDVLKERENYADAILLLDKLVAAPRGLINDPYALRASRAKVLCKVGRFQEAERECKELLQVLRRFPGGETVAKGCDTMFWYLVARHKGDTKKAMAEFGRLR
jgi:predicted Zn-dependent protease